jgi:predicted PurR-regulated permease PerM
MGVLHMKKKKHLVQFITLVSILLILIIGFLVGCTSFFVENSIKSTIQLPERVNNKLVQDDSLEPVGL